MVSPAKLESMLRERLPAHLSSTIPQLTLVLASLADAEQPLRKLRRHLDEHPELWPSVRALDGMEVGHFVLSIREIEREQQTRPLEDVNSAGPIDQRSGIHGGTFYGPAYGSVTFNAPPPPELPDELYLPPAVGEIVGREDDLARYRDQLATTRVTFIQGMAGVGKTTVGAALARSYLPLERIFWYEFLKDDEFDVVLDKLAIFLARHGDDGAWRQLHSGVPQKPAVMVDYLLPLLCKHDFLLCLDDLQHVDADPFCADFIERVLKYDGTGAASLLLISRHVSPIASDDAEVSLDGLSIDATRHVLSSQSLNLSDQLLEQLHQSVEGNAKLLMLAAKLIQSRPAQAAQIIAQIAKAPNIVSYIMSEVRATLSDTGNQIMGAVAVLLGEPASRDAIEAVLATNDLYDELYALHHDNMLHLPEAGEDVVADVFDERYVQHSLVREFYYHRLSSVHRHEMHRRAGSYYETLDQKPLTAARHYVYGDEPSKAAGLVTGNFWTLMNQGRVGSLRQLLEQFASDRLETAQWISVNIARAEVYTLLGESQQARACYETALAGLVAQEDTLAIRERRARVYRGLAVLSLRAGELAQAEAECASGLALLHDADQHHMERARLQSQLAEVSFRREEFGNAENLCREALDSLPPSPAAPRERTTILQRIATINGQRGEFEIAIQSLEECLPEAKLTEDLSLIAWVLHNLGTYLHYTGQRARAIACYKESIRLKEQVGDVANRVATLSNLGGMYLEDGAYEEALRLFADCQAICEQLRLPAVGANVLVNIGTAHYEQGNYDDARAALEQARTILVQLDSPNYLANCLFRLGDVALRVNDIVGARGYGEQALAKAQEAESTVYVPSSWRVIGEAALAEGQFEMATTMLDQALEVAKELDDPVEQELVLVALGQSALATGDYVQAAVHATTALVIADELANPFLALIAHTLNHQVQAAMHS